MPVSCSSWGKPRLVIDPVLGPRIGPVKRLGPVGLGHEQLGSVDRVLITHNHRDHLDGWTIKRLPESQKYLCPAGCSPMLERYGAKEIRELDWWQSVEVGEARIHFVPSRHWSMHFPWDRNEALWGGYVIEHKGLRIYHSGDTGFWPDFAEIPKRIGPIDYALLPTGAYAPRWFMAPQHMAPEEAVKTAELVQAKVMVAMHWGTFRLTDEHPAEGPALAEAAWEDAGKHRDRLWVLKAGETRALPPLT